MSESTNPNPQQGGKLTEEEKAAYVRSTRRFDLRRILGALFLLYGIIVLITGLVDPAADTKPTGGIAINLWTGIAMIIVGALFWVWDLAAPVPEEDIIGVLEREEEERAEGEGHIPGI
ncbi:hypothetical protein [Gryllotalpicola ginsengisoli]|uniref:hypothetical protein n=1 Tax=Gryllotalpicola ginsengisoli TaxID=444608 RepID=UPI0003B5E80B|nr:hypothetical protein [Gryllotalpicola ginsengisoli]